jgi:beta-glucosidase
LTFPKLEGAPLKALRAFSRVHVEAGDSTHVMLILQPRDLSYVNEAGDRLIAPGDYTLTVGGGQPGTSTAQVESHISMQGEMRLPE